LREQISNVQPPAPHHHHPHHPKNNNLMYFIIILLLLGAMAFAYNMKTGVITNWINKMRGGTAAAVETPPDNNPFPPDVTPPTPPAKGLDAEVKQLRLDLEKMKADDATRYAEVQKRLKFDNDRITLLGMLNNENFLVIRNEGANSPNYIYFNGDWTLSRQPQYLQLTDADRAFLERYRKKD